MPDFDKETQKEVVKEALQEWLDRQFAMVGRWTIRGLFCMSFAALMTLYLTQSGWSK